MPEALFFAPMNGWASRDVVAHLIGWNRLMIQACTSILAGDPPVYYSDAHNDYGNINAAFVQHYASRSKGKLLAELSLSMTEFENYLIGLPPFELTTDHGVLHYSGEPATVGKVIRSLAGDYSQHTRQIEAWLATR